MDLVIPLDSDRPTRAEIRLGALRRNFARARALAGNALVMAVVKADAYGHGLLRCAREFSDAGADYLGVALVEEGAYLREHGVRLPILVLGPPALSQAERFIRYGLDITLPSLEKAQAVSDAALALGLKARVQLKFDTGMGRIGVQWDRDPLGFFLAVQALPGLEIRGLFSHFSSADEDADYSDEQERRFREVLALIEPRCAEPPIAHMANSAALAGRPSSRFGMVRPGLMLYGYEPSPFAHTGVEPAMRLVSRVAYVKYLNAGARISYGGRHRLAQASRIATVPIGYADGYPRGLSGLGRAIVRGRSYPIAGTVCMDQLMLDLGPDGEAYNGDDALFFGPGGDGRAESGIALQELCDALGTIPYELLCRVSARVPRMYVSD
jgi:alanine racemase